MCHVQRVELEQNGMMDLGVGMHGAAAFGSTPIPNPAQRTKGTRLTAGRGTPADEDRATALAEIDYSDASFAHPAIIGVSDVGERHTDRCEEDFRLAFFVSTGYRDYIF